MLIFPQKKERSLMKRGKRISSLAIVMKSKGFCLLNPKTNKLVIARDVIFDELVAWQWEENVQESKNLEVPASLEF